MGGTDAAQIVSYRLQVYGDRVGGCIFEILLDVRTKLDRTLQTWYDSAVG